ncbi:MAG: NAD(P)-dependent oxidoreductase [Acidobacteriota bacterium]
MIKKILTIGPLPSWVMKRFAPEYEIVTVEDSDRSEVLRACDESVIAIIARGAVMIDGEIMDRSPSLKLIARTGVGYDSVSIPDATARGIPVTYTPGAMTKSVAEHAMSLIFSAFKKLAYWQNSLKNDDWNARYREKSRDLEQSTLGIVGYGRIGRQLRLICKPLEMKVLADDPYINHAQYHDDDVTFTDLEGVLRNSDVISLHVPLNEETTGLINHENIRLIKPGTTLINTSRGRVIENLDILYQALEEGILGAAGLDVYPNEPPETHHPIFSHPRAILTGHVAARSPLSQERILLTMLKEVLAILEGKKPDPANIVNPETIE